MLSVLSVIAAMRHFSVVGGKRQAVENGNCDARYHKAQRSRMGERGLIATLAVTHGLG